MPRRALRSGRGGATDAFQMNTNFGSTNPGSMGRGPTAPPPLRACGSGRVARWPACGGFTLFELLVTLAILAGIAALTLPALTGKSATELKATTRTLAAGLRRTRSQAMTRNASLAFVVDVQKRRFEVKGDIPPRTLPSDIDLSLVTARSELLGEQAGAIRFFPDGSSTGGQIKLGYRAQLNVIDVDWLTGQVRIYEDAQRE